MTKSIGTAHMKDDGTIELSLIAQGKGIIGDALVSYPPDHRDYLAILNHISPISQGETKQVPPWEE